MSARTSFDSSLASVRFGPVLFLGKKLARYAACACTVVAINFILSHMMPGDPLRNILGERSVYMSEEVRRELRHEYGLDRPIAVQFVSHVKNACSGDLGYSLVRRTGVSELIGSRLPWTLAMMVPATIAGAFMALLAGTIAGSCRGGKLDVSLTILFTGLSCLPMVIAAMISLGVFGAWLQWFPMGSYSSGNLHGIRYVLDIAWHMALPLAVLSLFSATYVFVQVRNSAAHLADEYFVFAARSRGIPRGEIAFRHIIRNALPPFIANVALDMGYMVSGAVVVEIVFSLNGMGLLIHDAVIARDYPVIQGCFIVLTLFVLTANMFADIAYCVADPRVGDSSMTT